MTFLFKNLQENNYNVPDIILINKNAVLKPWIRYTLAKQKIDSKLKVNPKIKLFEELNFFLENTESTPKSREIHN